MLGRSTAHKAPEESVEELLESIKTRADQLWVGEEQLEEMGVFRDNPWLGRDEWRALQPRLAALAEERERQDRMRSFRSAIRKAVISAWIRECAKVTDESQQRSLQTTIDIYLQEDRTEELSDYLIDVARGGTKQADKNRKRMQWGSGGYVGHAWTLVVGLVKIAVALAIFSVATSKFETVLLALAVMLYLSVEGNFRALHFNSAVHAQSLEGRFRRLWRVLHEEEQDWERELYIESHRKAEKELARATIRVFIRDILSLAVWLIALWQIIEAAVL